MAYEDKHDWVTGSTLREKIQRQRWEGMGESSRSGRKDDSFADNFVGFVMAILFVGIPLVIIFLGVCLGAYLSAPSP